MAQFEIRSGLLDHPQVVALLEEHLEEVRHLSPPESTHALDHAALAQPNVEFWGVWEGDELVGCGAMREIESGHGEIKSMRTASVHRRRGVASVILQHLIAVAEDRQYHRLSLETGADGSFAAARALYRHFGFEPCAPFTGYCEDPNSAFMTLQIDQGSR